MAYGVPCVVTDVGDSALLVGDSGIVTPSNDSGALAEGLAKCVSRLRTGQSPNPRLRIGESFDAATLVKRTEAALTALIQT